MAMRNFKFLHKIVLVQVNIIVLFRLEPEMQGGLLEAYHVVAH